MQQVALNPNRLYLDVGRESRWAHSMLFDFLFSRLIKSRSIVLVLLRDAVFERAIELRLFKKVAKSLQHGVELRAGLPGVWLEKTQADVAEIIVCHVGVIDAGDELDDRGLEWVVGGKGEEDAEFAWVVDGRGGRRQGNVPGVDGLVGRERHGEALRGLLGNFGKFLRLY